MNQSLALSLLKSWRNVFLTGEAGSGKTYVINHYVQRLRSCGIQVAITASTGIAATHIGGVTIHSRSGIGIKNELTDHDMELLQQKEHLHKQINKAKVLIIDEISMLSAHTLDMIDRVVQMHRRDGRPFGGMQVVFVGDFFQLPPVMGLQADGSESPKRFAFAAQAWKHAELVFCYLETQHRQAGGAFAILLNTLRKWIIDAEAIALLKTRMSTRDAGQQAVLLYTHNVDVDRINQEKLDALPDEVCSFQAQWTGEKAIVTALKKSLLAPEYLHLKVGAQVIFVKNNPQKSYRNGTTGVVVSFDSNDGYPVVKLANGYMIKAEPETRSIENATDVVASVKQIPLKLAWAITIHKSQGMTLDAAAMDLSRVFEPGQAYVALSRVRSLESLYLLGLSESGLKAHPLVIRADRYFMEESGKIAETFQSLSETDRQVLHEKFVTMLGGSYVAEEQELIKQLPKEYKTKPKTEKGDTVKMTLSLVKEWKTLEEIAQIRELAYTTILEHICKIHRIYPDVSLKSCKPDETLLSQVRKVVEKIWSLEWSRDAFGRLLLKPLFDALGGAVSYQDLKLCLLFVE